MEIAVIIVFFLLIILLGLCRGFKERSKRENIFYILSIALSLMVLLLKSLNFSVE